jgi:hypothetical protein
MICRTTWTIGATEPQMGNSGAVTLGDIADKDPMLEVAGSRCERHGGLSVALG